MSKREMSKRETCHESNEAGDVLRSHATLLIIIAIAP
jgi:hypothetical protein